MSITGIPGNIPHQGIKERTPPELHISRTRSPMASDNGPQFKIGDIWVDTSAPSFFVLLGKEQGNADWAVGGGAGSGVLTINTILPDGGGDFTILGGTNVTVTPGVNSITISSLDVGATSFPGDTGTANEAAGVLNIFGGPGVDTTGAANTISINIAADVARFYAVDMGGPAVPVLNTLDIVGSTSSDFTGSGIETNVGATTNEIYLENRRFMSAFIVDANTTVGTRGEYSTLAAATTDATAGDTVYIRPGSYAAFTPKIGVSYVGATAVGQNSNVVIAGTVTMPVGAGTVSFKNVEISAGGSAGLIQAGGAGSVCLFLDGKVLSNTDAVTLTSGILVMERSNIETAGATSALIIDGVSVGSFRNCEFTGFAGGATIVQSAAATTTFDACTVSTGDESVQGQAGTMNFQECQLSPGMNLELVTVNFDHSSIDALGATTGASIEAGTVFTGRFSRVTSPGEQAFEVNGAATINLYKMIIDASSGGNWIDVIAGATLDYSDVSLLSDVGIGTGGTITSTQWKPHGDTAGNVGVNSYLAADFAVDATGVVSSLSTAADTFPSDNGTGTPLAGAMSFVDSTSSDFANSGLETHVGATANELYIENRRFPSAFIVDPSSTVGTRGEFTTITAALAAASAGDTVYVRPGTYTENISVKLGTNLVGLSAAGEGGLVNLAGTLNAAAGAGTTTVQNINGIDSGSARSMELNGGAGSNMLFIDCEFTEAGNCVRWVSGNVTFKRCNLTSTGSDCIGADSTGGGTLECDDCNLTGANLVYGPGVAATAIFRNCNLETTSGATAINDSGAGTMTFRECSVIGIVETESGTITMEYCDITRSFQTDDGTATFRYCNWGEEINADDAATFEIHHCSIATAVSSGITIGGGAGGTANVTHTHIDTPVSPAVLITAGDTMSYSHLTFEQNSELSGAITQMPLPCSFHAFLPSTDATATGNGTVYTMGGTTALTERFDSGANFVPATGVFTAPVTGTYYFDVRWVLGVLTNAADDLVANVVTTAVTYEISRFSIEATRNPANENGFQGSVFCQMSSGDTATFTVTESGTAADTVSIIGAAGGTGSYVMGWLVS